MEKKRNMITLFNFLELAMDDYYKINIYYINGGCEIVHQMECGEIIDYFEDNEDITDLLYNSIASWDIEETTKELTINI